eukprot:7293579-Alexandrium_andersonii.AAC.1
MVRSRTARCSFSVGAWRMISRIRSVKRSAGVGSPWAGRKRAAWAISLRSGDATPLFSRSGVLME